MISTRTTKVIYWATTSILFLFDGVLPALTSHTEMAVEGVRHLGYPDYFRVMLTIFKILGALALVLPFVRGRVKEWAYAGFGFNFICAFISHWVVDGMNGETVFPLIVLATLMVSYVTYHKLVKDTARPASQAEEMGYSALLPAQNAKVA